MLLPPSVSPEEKVLDTSNLVRISPIAVVISSNISDRAVGFALS